MKYKLHTIGLAAMLALFTVGCGSVPKISPALVQSGVTVGVREGVHRYPSALPYVKASGEVICSAANSTAIDPAKVVEALSAVDAAKTPEGVLITQIAIDAYTFIWNSYGEKAAEKTPELRLYLQAVCNGVNAGTTESIGSPSSYIWPQIK